MTDLLVNYSYAKICQERIIQSQIRLGSLLTNMELAMTRSSLDWDVSDDAILSLKSFISTDQNLYTNLYSGSTGTYRLNAYSILNLGSANATEFRAREAMIKDLMLFNMRRILALVVAP